MNIEELIGVKYGSKVLLRSNVKFGVLSNSGFSYVSLGNIYSGVRAEKINKSLFSVSISGKYDGEKVKLSPPIKFGSKKYSKGALLTTDNGTNLFIPEDTLKLIQKKRFKTVDITYSNGSKIKTSVNGSVSNDELRDYYRVGSKRNIGSDKDLIVTIKKVKIS